MMGTLRGFPNPPALWLRWAKPTFANAVMETEERYEKLNSGKDPPRVF